MFCYFLSKKFYVEMSFKLKKKKVNWKFGSVNWLVASFKLLALLGVWTKSRVSFAFIHCVSIALARSAWSSVCRWLAGHHRWWMWADECWLCRFGETTVASLIHWNCAALTRSAWSSICRCVLAGHHRRWASAWRCCLGHITETGANT